MGLGFFGQVLPVLLALDNTLTLLFKQGKRRSTSTLSHSEAAITLRVQRIQYIGTQC